MEFNEETTEQDDNEYSQTGSAKQWLQDNLRIIISVLIVVLIAGGIYSYSKRSAEVAQEQPDTQAADILKELESEEGQSAIVEEGTKETPKAQEKKDTTSSVATSQETEKSFVETAAKGDGTTKLARRALANYLEKNPDSALTAEHKIYIEDYLRKNAGHKGSVRIGTSVEFSKDQIADAITKSKNLNEKQLKNLHKYAVRVPSLS